ncbi:ubiquinone biosynthesis protein COQ9 [Roseovarius marisflavi]|uniref:Ubiquinone biosynthesis protein COQ9 n=1 Tax=Roseovarius marisflavi TaxID=1054996 RepID=A0A1M7A7H9_9RHOB|nr:COQ9 family protein [Roseovarius marisflavi]SHL38631.1 ubiquinone biosynthesis protein COQ9 [Roseovarius marisflavi]
MHDPDLITRLLDAAKMHVPFDGWSEATLKAAASDADIDPGLVAAICPRGAVDLALAYHEAGDQAMLARLEVADLGDMRFRDRIAFAVRARLEAVEDKELVRRGVTLFSLPVYAADGARAIWQTCDRIWLALGDTSDDVNWYTKRATLSGVYGATVLYWLGDDSEDHARTWEFLDRRIEDVMQIEKFKAQARDNRLMSGLMAGPVGFLTRIRAPQGGASPGMPGRWNGPT